MKKTNHRLHLHLLVPQEEIAVPGSRTFVRLVAVPEVHNCYQMWALMLRPAAGRPGIHEPRGVPATPPLGPAVPRLVQEKEEEETQEGEAAVM